MKWFFGYGSLMWDGWEKDYDCRERVVANLNGYGRVFNKASVRNWGTNERPGPTLNIARNGGAVCTGIAFGFEDGEAVQAYLNDREGGFEFRTVDVTLQDGRAVSATTSLYRGRNLLSGHTTAGLVAMTLGARGTDGRAVDYVLGIERQLKELGIADAAVEHFARAVTAAI